MTAPTLEALGRCFQGLIPSTIATCSRDGTPNLTSLSQVYFVDPQHVALSCQFFNKTRRNVEENPFACIELIDPVTFDCYRLHARYVRSETTGPLFEAMALRIQALASITGMEGIFRLLSADVYRVDEIEPVAFLSPLPGTAPAPEPAPLQSPYVQVRGMGLVSQRINRSRDLDDLLASVLASLDELFGLGHSMVLVPDDGGRRLVTIAAHGYERGVGAEVNVGDGWIGAVAEQRRPLRISDVRSELRYGRAIRQKVAEEGARGTLRPEIALPGLHDGQSQLALPLLVQDRLVGVLALESRDPLAFDDWDEALLDILANQLAIGIDKYARVDDEPAPTPAQPPPAPPARPGVRRTFTLFRNDDCVFVDGEYLIRNVPGLILWKLLTEYREGRTEFTNRELRLDPSLKLPELRDNLESRLILLRRRLEQQCPDVRIVPVRRGRFALEVKCEIELQEKHG